MLNGDKNWAQRCLSRRIVCRTGGRKPIQLRKVLIVDDEFLIRWSLGEALSREGFEVVSVEDGKKAMEAAKGQHFDFVITDLIMPEMEGWEVLERMRQKEPPPRIIIITAHGDKETERLATEKGAWAYVEKPFVIDQIKELLKHSTKSE